MTQKRKRLSGPEKIAIVKRYLVERVPISDLCDDHGLQPSQSGDRPSASHGQAYDFLRGLNERHFKAFTTGHGGGVFGAAC